MLKAIYQEICQTLFRCSNLAAAAEPLIRKILPWYRAGFYSARILQMKPEAGCLRLLLKVSTAFPLFKAGQHLQLRVCINGVEMERTFSICSPLSLLQQQRQLELAIQIQPDGRFTPALASVLRPGSYVHLSQPHGEFVMQHDKPACLIAAGTGVTPLFAMLSSVSRLITPMLFVYCYRGDERLLFANEWPALQARFPLLRLVLWDTSQRGRLTPDILLQQLKPIADSRFYLCGPRHFTTDFSTGIQASGVAAEQIRSESFGGLVRVADPSQPVHLRLGRQSYQLAGQGSILQRAEQAGLTLPYGCRRGVCMQCLCDKSSGVVRNLLTGALSDPGPGRIQLCISEAVSAVEINSVELKV